MILISWGFLASLRPRRYALRTVSIYQYPRHGWVYTECDLIVTYNLYQQLGVDGLRGLSNYDVTTGVSRTPIQSSTPITNGSVGMGSSSQPSMSAPQLCQRLPITLQASNVSTGALLHAQEPSSPWRRGCSRRSRYSDKEPESPRRSIQDSVPREARAWPNATAAAHVPLHCRRGRMPCIL